MGIFRGIIAVLLGGFFLFLSSIIPLTGFRTVHQLVISILLTTGGLMVFIGLSIILHYLREHRIRRTMPPTTGLIFIRKSLMLSETLYSAIVQLSDRQWSIELTGGRIAAKYCDGRSYEGVIWTDPDTRSPLALSIQGKRLEAMPGI